MTGNGNTVVRGGYGLFYGHIRMLGTLGEFQQLQAVLDQHHQPGVPGSRTRAATPAAFIVTSQAPNITVVANDMMQPLSKQFTAGVSQRLSELFALHVDFVNSRTKGDYKTLDINARDPRTGLRPLPQFTRVDQMRPDTDLKYKALYTKLEKRFSQRPSVHGVVHVHRQRRQRADGPLSSTPSTPRSNGARRAASGATPWSPADRCCCRGTSRSARSGPYRSQLPWSATAGRDVNGDTFNTDLVPGTTRNSGSRDLDLAAVNAWRALNNLAAIAESPDRQLAHQHHRHAREQERALRRNRKLDLMVQAFNIFNTEEPAGAVRRRTRRQRAVERLRAHHQRAAERQIELAVRLMW